MQRKLLQVFLIFTLAVSAIAQQQQRQAANFSPNLERLRAHVRHLASDKLEGRKTGTMGARLAAEYISKEFSRYGLKPGVGQNSQATSKIEADSTRRYMQEFPFIAGVELGKDNSMFFKPDAGAAALDLRLGEDWTPLGFSSSSRIESKTAVFASYGIKADELNHNDYAGLELRDRIAIVFAGTPDDNNPHGSLARYGGVRWKAVAARNAGASALIVIAREEYFKDEPLARLTYDNAAGGEAGIPVVVISRQAAARILSAGGLAPLNELEIAARSKTTFANPHGAAQADTTSIPPQKGVSAELQKVALTLTTNIVRRNAPAYNVVGILEGSDPRLKNEVIVIGAHYDHLGRGGESSLSDIANQIHHGADDNASGVAGMLELARIFSGARSELKRTLVFAAFGGEEEGLLGSNFYVNHPLVPNAQTVAMINMDMIGRMKNNRLMIGGAGTATEWRDMIASANIVRPLDVATGNAGPRSRRDSEEPPRIPIVISTNGQVIADVDPKSGKINVTLEPPLHFQLTLNEDGFGPSDHSSFYAKQVPVLFFFTGTHDDYHKPSDTADKINYEDAARILSFIIKIVRAVNDAEKPPTYTVAKSQMMGRATGFRVYLGTIPNYAESTDGLKLDGVREDSPAAKAGLKAGDRIIRMAGREVRNVYDYTAALAEMKAGQEYEVEAVRGAETLKLKITPASRK